MPCRKIASNYLWTEEGLVRDPLVEADSDGRIVSVSTCVAPDKQADTEFYAGILTPGFVNAHCHLELSHLRGAIPEGCGFSGFAQGMGAFRGKFSDAERMQAMAAADAAMWHAGISGVGDISNNDSSFSIKSGSKIAYHTFVEFFGLRNASAEGMALLLHHPHTSLTPHSIYSVQDAPFRSICAEGDAPLSIHFMESAGESALFNGCGELHAWYEQVGFTCDFLHYGSPAQRIVRSIPASRRVMLVHNCCVTESDIDLIRNHFTSSVSWCLCPRSNRHISHLTPPVDLLRTRKAHICIGTDSLASNDTLSILEELKLLGDVPLTELLGWATIGGARALGLDGELGRVAAGRRCGLNVVSGIDYERMSLTAASQVQRIL